MSDWLRSDVGEAFVDNAYYAIGTLPVGPLTLALEGWQVGPRFITGGNDSRRSGNGQTGAYIDTMMEDTERGRPRTYAYQTIMREPLAMTNNSRHGAVKSELKLAWMTLASTLGYSEQIVPSGPWVQSHFVLNGLGYNGAGWFWRFGQAYAQLPQGLTAPPGGALNNQYAFASATQAPAFYNGAPMGSTYWQEVGQVLYQETQTHVLMSQTGVGDANILADSIKYTTSLRSSVAFDLKPVFDRDLPFDLSVSNDLRDTNDQANFPRLTDEHLLTQMVTEAALRYGWSNTVELLAAAGYETWLTRHSRFPLFYISRFYGAGFDLKLDEILTGMSLQARTQRFEFEDMHFMQRNHHDWSWSIGTSIYY